MNDFELYSQSVLNLALLLPRLAAAFVVLPLLSNDTMPAMMRNVFLVSLALVLYPLHQAGLGQAAISGVAMVPLVLKEIFIGIVLGYMFSVVFWALEGAGQVIDNKSGATTAQIVDPLSGHQTSLTGAFMARFAGYLFVAFGGLTVFLELLFESYLIWPIVQMLPDLNMAGQALVVERFGDLMQLILLFAAPALVLLTLVELGFGFMNRYAPQVNVFAISMPVKSWLGIAIVLLMLGTVVETVVAWVAAQRDLLTPLGNAL